MTQPEPSELTTDGAIENQSNALLSGGDSQLVGRNVHWVADGTCKAAVVTFDHGEDLLDLVAFVGGVWFMQRVPHGASGEEGRWHLIGAD